MRAYIFIINCLILGNLKNVQSTNDSNNKNNIGVSEEALSKLMKIKKLELDILKDFVKKDTGHSDIYKKFHCISSDYISFDKKEGKDGQANKGESANKSEQETKGSSFIDKITSFIGIFNYNKINNIYSEKIHRMHNNIKEENNVPNEDASNKSEFIENHEITKNEKPNSYMELSTEESSSKALFPLRKEKPNENYKVGNLGSFYMIFGASNIDYPWACTCDPLQLIEYKEKKRNYVLCSNQVDMSIQNSDLYCNPKNSSHYFYLSYILILIIIIISL
ncbi:conserved Plasmodium protein, unknown function [Plasmodium berghei]|uniref:Apical membrane antigen 1 n=2 Tax=Plasmodium berghei TaxID=5821 RepID=A0A509AN23_PLABA|nr:conserved protein, unknown function [Plasmodium berghei ANKA]CXI50540.1 conserved Plasmodium protein, unknown function [Plasmodium berghei]SCL94286.1 conserved Plasmodium protein, unknown function [Plasmodium berghei]SCM15979.1 conserved Plasmodium protein, unknown function [Plasmodium berghei]SCM17775.1 conserved Plasmodium protein, unknown function [Plasmodium berghei]SCN26004.1 conserved Plasmodium protein, unknown function [Plasmodium berghei]|eukprot:XP_034421904.1 conserved protein, unknown function [Plasmodium berghei ANKA]